MAKAKKKKKKGEKAKKNSASLLGAVSVTFDSAPRSGMAMKLNSKKLKALPVTKILAPGDHPLEWTFVGPAKSEFSVIVMGVRIPKKPIKGKVREGNVSESGFIDVLV